MLNCNKKIAASLLRIFNHNTCVLVGCRHASKSTPTPVAAEGREADRFPLNLWFPEPNFAGRSIRESGLGNFKPFTIKDDNKILNKNLEDNHVDFLEHKRNSESQNRKKSKLGAKKRKQSKSSLKKMSKTTALKYKIAKTPSRLKTPKRLKKQMQRKRLIRTSKLLPRHKKSSSNKRGGKIQQQTWLKQRFRWHSSGMNNSAAFSAEFRELIHEYCTPKKYKTIAEIETIFDQKG